MKMENTDYEPKRQWRWIFQSEGFDTFTTKEIRQTDSRTLEVYSYVPMTTPLGRPPIQSGGGKLLILGEQGNVIDECSLFWAHVEYLPVNYLDYTSRENLVVKTILRGVTFSWK